MSSSISLFFRERRGGKGGGGGGIVIRMIDKRVCAATWEENETRVRSMIILLSRAFGPAFVVACVSR